LFNLYEKHYLKWSDNCFYTESTTDGRANSVAGQKVYITPESLIPIVEAAAGVSSTIAAAFGLLFFMILMQLFEVGAVFMHRQEAISKKT